MRISDSCLFEPTRRRVETVGRNVQDAHHLRGTQIHQVPLDIDCIFHWIITVDSLELSGDYRTAFDIGEDLDFTGMQVKALISDGTEQEVPWTDLTIEGYNKNQRGEQTLKLSYKEAFTQLTVTVLKKDAGMITVSLTLLGDSVHNSDTDGT